MVKRLIVEHMSNLTFNEKQNLVLRLTKMALISSKLLTGNLKKSSVLLSFTRTHWNKDYKPGPYPTTPEEREKAALKYGILPEEYKPMPDDGCGKGDYPDLPLISTEAKDPYYPYDYPELKRNFNEPIHFHADIIGEDRLNLNQRWRYPLSIQVLQFVGVLCGSAIIYFFMEDKKMFIGVIPKQYPYQGKTHYTFDVAEEMNIES